MCARKDAHSPTPERWLTGRPFQSANSTRIGVWSEALSRPRIALSISTDCEPVGRLRRQQQVVDADAVVPLPGAGLIIPERVEAAGVRRRPQGVGEAERHEFAEGLPRPRQEQRVAGPLLRMGGVDRFGNDVEVAGQHQRLLVFEELARVADQPLHEGELVGVLFRVGRIAVRQIDAGEPHDAVVRRDDRLDVTRLDIGVVARQPADDLERTLRQDRDAVESLLPMRLDVIAERLDLEPRELLVQALDLLQAERVGRDLAQIVAKMPDPLADGVDVPGGDAQGA